MTFDYLLDFGNLDWPAILVGAAAAMVFGFLWYGPLFGKVWASKSGASMQSGDPGKLAATAVYLLVFNMALQYLRVAGVGSDDFEHAIVAGIVLGVLTVGPALFGQVIWAKKNAMVFLIDLGHWLLSATISVFVQGLVF
jgi:hypothetical protein